MKNEALILILSCWTLVWLSNTSSAQQTYAFDNFTSVVNAPVFDAAGNPLFGTDYLAVLYGGPSPDALQLASGRNGLPMTPAPFTSTPLGMKGYFGDDIDRYTVLNNVPCGGLIPYLQVRAWDARLGASYEEVVSLGIGGYGESTLFRARGGQPFECMVLATPPGALNGLQSFSISAVIPEPNPTWLLLLGLPGLLIFLRRGR